MAQSGTVCCWAIRLWYSRMTCAYSALAYSAPRRSIRARMMSGAACGSGCQGGDHRVILRERRAGQRVTRLFFAGRGIGKAHQFGGGVQLQVTLFRRRQFDAIRRCREQGNQSGCGSGSPSGWPARFCFAVHDRGSACPPTAGPSFCPAAGRHRRASAGAQRSPAPPPATSFAERLAVLAGIGERFDIADTIVVAAGGPG